MQNKIIASEILLQSVNRHQIHLSLLVAETGLWVNPEYHSHLIRTKGHVAVFPNIRRARISQGEKRNQIIDGIRLDDNTYANLAIKRAIGFGKNVEGFETCHIWPGTCYNENYHTAIANLVLLPRALAGLTDHDPEIQQALQFRAFELYNWYPEGFEKPQKPVFYPTDWRKPLAMIGNGRTRLNKKASGSSFSKDEFTLIRDRIERWSNNPSLKVHKIIALVVKENEIIYKDILINRISEVTQSKNSYGAISSLMTNTGNAYGRVFFEKDGQIFIIPELVDFIESLKWSAS